MAPYSSEEKSARSLSKYIPCSTVVKCKGDSNTAGIQQEAVARDILAGSPAETHCSGSSWISPCRGEGASHACLRWLFHREHTTPATPRGRCTSGVFEEIQGGGVAEESKERKSYRRDVPEVLTGKWRHCRALPVRKDWLFFLNEKESHWRVLEEWCDSIHAIYLFFIYISTDSCVLILFYGWKPNTIILFCCCSN